MNWWFPSNASSVGADIDTLFFMILYVTAATFFIVEIGLVVFMIKYRRREGRKAEYIEGSTKAEIIWTAIPAVGAVLLGLVSQPLWVRIKAQVPEGATVYDVTGKQFEWHIRYPGPDGRLETDDDIFKRNEMRVIVNRDYVLQLHAEDVIHSFFVPAFRVKQDAVPGLEHNRAWFRATRTGEFEIACAELCGLGHYRMRARVIVQTAAEFAAWQASQVTPAAPVATTAGRAAP